MRTILSTVLLSLICAISGLAVDVPTYHNDNKRTAVNSQESALSPTTVTVAQFGKVGFWPTDGQIVAMPLFLSGLTIGGAQHNVVYAVTEHDSVYAFDAASGQVLWQTSAIYSGEHVSSFPNCSSVSPEIGITGTPVIDRSSNAIYFVASTQDASNNYHHRLYALSLTTGTQLRSPTEIKATYQGPKGGPVIFNPAQHLQRPALLELNGYLYIGFGSHCDGLPYYGWLMEYKASTLTQTSVLNFAPYASGLNGSAAALWMGGAGPAADSQGYIYVETANGTFDTKLNDLGFPYLGNYGNSALKIKPGITSPMSVVDYFTMTNTVFESADDIDLGSGGPVVVDVAGAPPLVVAIGKDTNMYVLNRNNMGKWDPNQNHIYQELDGALNYGSFAPAAFFNNTLYFGSEYGHISAWRFNGANLPSIPTSQSTNTFALRGSAIAVSAYGTSNGVIWAPECINCLDSATGFTNEILHAYDASDLSRELYNTTQAGNRDFIGDGNKFITPLIANGRVYLGMTNGVTVFGHLSSAKSK